jgi:hypothetical protein
VSPQGTAAYEGRLFSVELDARRAALAAELFADQPQVTIFHGDWTEIAREAPFDLLVLDGGGQGKSDGIAGAQLTRKPCSGRAAPSPSTT